MHRHVRIYAATCTALVLATLTACGATGKATAEAKPNETISAATEPAEATETAIEDETAPLTGTVDYDDGVSVHLENFVRGVSSAVASPENTPYIKFTLKLHNGSKSTMDLNELSVQCMYGDEGRQGDQIFDEGLDMPTTHLRPGRAVSATTACELPKGEHYLQIEVTPNAETETAIFAGDVK
ncbi:hypothetical protein C3486_24850 [Streptomyces sp. Ru73]|uniref:hypothetical protein n=1 Tax=Streptomyces sp. Ru73 TaxID=2080748 RepID=UPI000CDD2BD4|nr:hypothetical protein [Streptomyces sp. Ru73]POX38093.1 hypothetical protein C3486_24850 [Streptomyces sp. Ru73]